MGDQDHRPPAVVAGIDVGGPRKGFHVCALRGEWVVQEPVNVDSVEGTTQLLCRLGVTLAAVDCPREPARLGEKSRADERALRREVCGIRYTPDEATLNGHSGNYYDWVLNGLDLYSALADVSITAVECFPTATFTRVLGSRGRRTRGAWSTEAIALIAPAGLPGRMNQDERDCVAAARTAQAYRDGGVEMFGDIAVPRRGWSPHAR